MQLVANCPCIAPRPLSGREKPFISVFHPDTADINSDEFFLQNLPFASPFAFCRWNDWDSLWLCAKNETPRRSFVQHWATKPVITSFCPQSCLDLLLVRRDFTQRGEMNSVKWTWCLFNSQLRILRFPVRFLALVCCEHRLTLQKSGISLLSQNRFSGVGGDTCCYPELCQDKWREKLLIRLFLIGIISVGHNRFPIWIQVFINSPFRVYCRLQLWGHPSTFSDCRKKMKQASARHFLEFEKLRGFASGKESVLSGNDCSKDVSLFGVQLSFVGFCFFRQFRKGSSMHLCNFWRNLPISEFCFTQKEGHHLGDFFLASGESLLLPGSAVVNRVCVVLRFQFSFVVAKANFYFAALEKGSK